MEAIFMLIGTGLLAVVIWLYVKISDKKHRVVK